MGAPHTWRRISVTAGFAIAGCLSSAGCTAGGDSTASEPITHEASPEPGPTTPATASYIPTTYRFDLTSSCGERGFLGTYRVSVRAGVVVAARPLDPTNSYQPDLAEVPSLQGLVDMAASADPGADVQLETDPAGLPTYLSIDHLPDAIDDEECYEIANIRRLDP
jgi:hypothetical protein